MQHSSLFVNGSNSPVSSLANGAIIHARTAARYLPVRDDRRSLTQDVPRHETTRHETQSQSRLTTKDNPIILSHVHDSVLFINYLYAIPAMIAASQRNKKSEQEEQGQLYKYLALSCL
jgi:hypothetical protein